MYTVYSNYSYVYQLHFSTQGTLPQECCQPLSLERILDLDLTPVLVLRADLAHVEVGVRVGGVGEAVTGPAVGQTRNEMKG